jgi:hypothetical protein
MTNKEAALAGMNWSADHPIETWEDWSDYEGRMIIDVFGPFPIIRRVKGRKAVIIHSPE